MSVAREAARAELRALADTETSAVAIQGLVPGTRLAGRYRVERQIGLGGMGVVYKARDEELGVDVALKVLQSDLATRPGWLERFRQELVLAREVTHKNVVRIHDIGESQGVVFLTMGLVDGRALHDLLERDGPLPLERALRIFRQVAEAVQQAHEAGVVHRDLKPANVLVAADDRAYVTDFGVACWLHGDGLTGSGVVVGTLDYLSPEQAAGGRVDARSDIYALGILLFEMLSGQLPFPGDSRAEALARRIAGRTRDLAETGVRAPAYVRHALRRCLARSPSRRYASARALLADLEARRAPVLEQVRRPLAGGLAAAALAAGLGLAYVRVHAGGPAGERAPTAAAPAGVAVLPLSDETGDPALAWTANGVAEMLAAQLAESPELRVLDPSRVQQTLRDLGLAGGVRDEAELRRLAQLYGVGRIVTGSLRRAGDALRVDLRVVAVLDDGRLDVRSAAAETQAAAGLFQAVAGLGRQLSGDLGAAGSEAGAPPPRAIPLAAAQAYREGRERLSVGDALGAAPAFERAVQADAEFAAAYLGLAESEQLLGRAERALAAARRAADLAGAGGRLAGRARARLALLTGDAGSAERSYAELVRRYPNDAEAWLELASAQAGQGRVAEAVRSLKRVTELDRSDARAWLQLGRNMILAGDVRAALTDPLVRALALMTQFGNEQGRGDVLNAMGVGQQRLGDYPQAAQSYGEAAEVRRRIGDERGLAVSLKNRAGVRLALGRFAEAEPDLRTAAELYARLGERRGQAEVWNEWGGLHEARGDYAAARQAYEAALRIRRELADERQLAQSYDNVGYSFFLDGEYENARVYWQQALGLRRKLGDRAGVVLSTQNLGFLQTAQGRFPEAMKSFLEALEDARAIEFKNALAVSHGNIGLLQHYSGRYAAALDAYGQALATLEGLGDKRGLAEYSLKQALVLIDLGRLEEARARVDAAGVLVQATGNREQAADWHAARGQLQLLQGDGKGAARDFALAVEDAAASHGRAARLRAEIARDAGRVAFGEAAAARPPLEEALRAAEAAGDAVLRIRAGEALAGAELALGRLRSAEGRARATLELAERCGFEAGLYRLYALLGRIQARRGDAGAERSYGESARRLALLREGLAGAPAAFERLPVARELQERRAAPHAVQTASTSLGLAP